MIKLYNSDSLEALKGMEDNQYDLAIVDVNYGIKQDGRNNHTRSKKAKSLDYRNSFKYDDRAPDTEYFDLLKMKSNNQIIFGANHFIDNFPFMCNSSCWIVWDKVNGNNDFADCELAWTSFKTAVRIFRFRWHGMLQGDMKNKQKYIHPNMKPIQLYKWLLKNYGFNKDGSKLTILDTHFGSLSIGIACADMGFNLTAYEIDVDYFNSAVKRLYNHINQLNAFVSVPEILVNGKPINEYMKQISNV